MCPDLLLDEHYSVEVSPSVSLRVEVPATGLVAVESPDVETFTVKPGGSTAPSVEDPVGDTSVAVVPVAGPPGPAGGGYSHHQTAPAAQWSIQHRLGQYREPTLLLDTAPTVPVWADVEHLTADLTIITLPEPATGWAYL